jgi:hypothetical protein
MAINWSKIESALATVFNIALDIATIAEPVINVTNPGIASLYNLSVNAAMQAEQAGQAAASTQTTNAAKLAAIVQAVTPYLNQAAAAAGLSAPTQEKIEAYAQTVLDGLEIVSLTTTA